MPKVSVIVPVYNVENYLPQCLDSILAQTLKDIEIICVDDGSTDQSGEILDQYASKDKRFMVLHRANSGYGAAMNAGLDVAKGEYIGIAESDDCILPEMYETLYLAAVRDDLDLVKSDAIYWIESLGYRKRIHDPWLDDYYDRVLYEEDRNLLFDFFMNIWTGIYKRTFLQQFTIRFHESSGASYQDNGFWIQTLLYCQKAKWLNQAFYWYRQDNPQASVKSKTKIMAMTKEYEFLARTLCDRKDYHFLSYCYYYKLYRHRGTFLRIADEQKRMFCDQIQKDFRLYQGFIKGNYFLENWYRKIVKNPDGVCEEVIRKKAEVQVRLDHAGGIIIYGAGRRGDVIFRGLYQEGYSDLIRCFAVSQKPSGEMIAGKQILSIEEALRRFPDGLVILAVARGSGMYQQMAENLAALGITDYMDGSDLEENFYII
ncbi:MAG: glycosyltransferase [Hungatella sp.]|nr:glycosyltransferase [Hungatella sp.]